MTGLRLSKVRNCNTVRPVFVIRGCRWVRPGVTQLFKWTTSSCPEEGTKTSGRKYWLCSVSSSFPVSDSAQTSLQHFPVLAREQVTLSDLLQRFKKKKKPQRWKRVWVGNWLHEQGCGQPGMLVKGSSLGFRCSGCLGQVPALSLSSMICCRLLNLIFLVWKNTVNSTRSLRGLL